MSNKNTAIQVTLNDAQAFIVNKPQVLTDILNFQDESDNLDSIVARIEVANKLKSKTPNVSPQDVFMYKNNMSDGVFKLVKMARSKCQQIHNNEMLNKLNFHSNYIMRGDRQVCMDRANEISSLIHDNLAILTNILPANITAVNTIISTYSTARNIPEMTRKNKKSFGTALLKQALTDGRSSVLNMLQMLQAQYSVTDPGLVLEFKTLITINVMGVHHTPVNITFIDAITTLFIINGLLVRTTKKGAIRSFATNNKGVVVFKTHKPGKTEYIFKAAGYPDTSVTVTIIRGQKNNITISVSK